MDLYAKDVLPRLRKLEPLARGLAAVTPKAAAAA
jgi:hypothetical protein